ncbi:class I SAM-dependent methyltransferase [Leptospira sp. 'Mane']|uniref:class I SAM-dependent methyltransferase n=1 Tax=Leptospira sp. 'Mane' TaxID=3387407 RepID=UPI00398B29EF
MNSLSGALLMFENRLKKLKKDREKWSKRTGIHSYRIYDEDIPQVPVILDRYNDCFVLYDRSSLRFQDEAGQEERYQEIGRIVKSSFALEDENLFLKRRKKQKGKDQYEKLSDVSKEIWIEENGIQFLINLSDYLDTGLFLDHRITRKMVGEKVQGKSVLNLFCYTGSFTAYAAAGGASSTVSIDLSKTYIEWAAKNLTKNGYNLRNHELLCTDVIKWIRDESKNPSRKKYDLIVLDPPTFSNSKKMSEEWDVQENHRNLLLTLLTKFLTETGEIWFSTNFRKFDLSIPEEEWSKRDFKCIDLSLVTIPEDFRDKKIHKLYHIMPV